MRHIETKWRKGQIAGKYGLCREKKKKIPYENISDQKLAFPLSYKSTIRGVLKSIRNIKKDPSPCKMLFFMLKEFCLFDMA